MARGTRLPPRGRGRRAGGAVRAGGMRVSKKQENGPVEKNAKPPGKEKTSAIASFSQTQTMGVLLAEVLSKLLSGVSLGCGCRLVHLCFEELI